MATEQVPFQFLESTGEKFPSTPVEPKDFHIVWGENPEFWTLPTEDDPTAKLVRVNWLEVSGKVKVPQGKEVRLAVGFEIAKTFDVSGWGDYSDVLIGVKNGTMDKYLTTSIKRQVDYLYPERRMWVGWNVTVDSSGDDTLQFAFLHTDTATEKKGMVFYGANVQVQGMEP